MIVEWIDDIRWGIHLEHGMRTSTEGNENYVKLICESNDLINNGLLSSDAMANNCAILFAKSNPDIIKENDFLEIEINHHEKDIYKYKSQDLRQLTKDYDLIEDKITDFISYVKANHLDAAKRLIEPSTTIDQNNLNSFLTNLKSVIPQNYKVTKLIGYREINRPEGGYTVEAVLIGKDEIRRLVSATLVITNENLMLREINF